MPSKIRKTKKALVIGIVIIILGGIFLPIYNGSLCTLSPEKSCWSTKVDLLTYLKYQKNITIAESLRGTLPPLPKFPETIGGYRFDIYNHRTRTECEDLVEEKVCSDVTNARYVKDSTHEIVDLSFVRAITGKETLVKNQDRYFTWDKLEGYEVGWVEYVPKRFAWFPGKDIDVIVVNEGTLQYNKERDELPRYSDTTSGTSLVAVYFLEKYPPKNPYVSKTK